MLITLLMFEIYTLKNNKKIVSKRNNVLTKEKYLKYMRNKNVKHNHSKVCKFGTQYNFLFGRTFKDFIFGIKKIRMLSYDTFDIKSNSYHDVSINMHMIKSIIKTIKLYNIEKIRYHQYKQNFYDLYIIESLIKCFKIKNVFIDNKNYEIEISYSDDVVINKNYSILKNIHYIKRHNNYYYHDEKDEHNYYSNIKTYG